MLVLLADENFNGRILRGLLEKHADLTISRVQDSPAYKAPDPALLEYAAVNGAVVVTHDTQTMPAFAYNRVRVGLPMPGVIVVSQACPIGQAIEELYLTAALLSPDEIRDRVANVPM